MPTPLIASIANFIGRFTAPAGKPGSMLKVEQSRSERIDALFDIKHNLDPLFSAIGGLLVQESQAAFDRQRYSETIWPPRRVPNLAGAVRDLERGPYVKSIRFTSRPALLESGNLKRSIRATIQPDGVRISSSAPYAELHQKGGPTTVTVSTRVQTNLSELIHRDPAMGVLRGILAPKDRKSIAKGTDMEVLRGNVISERKLHLTVPARPFMGRTTKIDEQIRGLARMHLLDESVGDKVTVS